MEPIEIQLTELKTMIVEAQGKAAEETKTRGTIAEETKTKLDALQKQFDALDVKLAERHAAGTPTESIEDVLSKDENLKRFMRDKSGNHVITFDAKQTRQLFERKTNITSAAVGAMTTGVLEIDRIPGITPEARQTLTVRDLLSARPTNMQVVDFVHVNAPLKIASPQTEASDKGENALTFVSKSETVRTIATWIPASKQILDDMTELLGFINSALPYYVNLEEELQLLSGDSTGQNLDGLITQATAFNTALLLAVPGWNKIDVIGRAIQQITAAKELAPTFVIMHPTDWWSIRLTKDGFGRYILGDPQMPSMGNVGGMSASPVVPNLFGLTVVPTTSIATGTFLVGSGNPIAAEIRDRMGMQVELATQHASFFTANLIAIRAEKRLALIVKRPASYISGSFTTSP